MKVSPIASLFPLLSEPEMAALTESIRSDGLLVPITLDSQGRVLDGRNRLAACRRAKVKPTFTTFTGDDEAAFVLASNLSRRHLDAGQRAVLGAQLIARYKIAPGGRQRDHASRLLGVSATYVAQAQRLLAEAPDLAAAVAAGTMPFARALAVSRDRPTPTRSGGSGGRSDDVVSVVTGSNADLIREASRLWIPDGAKVVDLSYGRGVFWAKTDTTRFQLTSNDIATEAEWNEDYTALPFADDSYDVAVIDPPYSHDSTTTATAGRYRGEPRSHEAIMDDYAAAMAEANRIVVPNGKLFVKAQDEVSSSAQRWSHIEIYDTAAKLGMEAVDLFVLVPDATTPGGRWETQHHARKVHSFMWVMSVSP